MVRARFPTVTAIQLKVDFVILSLSETATTDIIYIDVLDLVNKNLSPPTRSLFLPGLSEKQVVDLVWPQLVQISHFNLKCAT